MDPRVILAVALGGALGLAWHKLTLPLTGGTCPLMCSPWRAVAVGAVMGWLLVGSLGPRPARPAAAPEDEETMVTKVQAGQPVHVTEAGLEKLVAAATGPILLDAYADWCAPCRMLAPELEKVAGELAGRLTVAKFNVDTEPGLAAQLRVRGIPALFLIDAGRVVASWTGYRPAEQLLDDLRPHLPAE